MPRLIIITVISVFLLPTVAQQQQTPCPRNQPVIVYHPKLQSFLLFGGYCSESKTRLKDLWSYSDGAWKEIETILTPSSRSGHAMVYDEKGDRVILFGGKGDDGSFFSNTWSWDGEDWALISKTGPEARQSHRLVYTDQGILLFGGSNKDGLSLGDTWLLKNNSWEEIGVTQAPPARRQHTLTFDSKRARTILFGGFDRKEGEKIIYGDTWEFNGIKWVQAGDNAELARDHHAMAYSPKSSTTLLFAGYNDGYLGDTWSWNGKEWKEIDKNGPARAGKPGMMYDANSSTMVFFGGGNSETMQLMDFWMFDPESNSWEQQ